MKFAIPILILLTTASVSAGSTTEEPVFSEVFSHYEAIRQVLIEDSTDGVASHARAIADVVSRLADDYSSAAAGVGVQDAKSVKAMLPEIVHGATRVAEADDLAAVRSELAELTKPLVRWHELVNGPRPVVAYCPMEKKAWLQPDEPVGNPYAPYMLRCGEVVQR
jgi:hypothetical protein